MLVNRVMRDVQDEKIRQNPLRRTVYQKKSLRTIDYLAELRTASGAFGELSAEGMLLMEALTFMGFFAAGEVSSPFLASEKFGSGEVKAFWISSLIQVRAPRSR
jgi:hypothetical protein